MKKKGHRIQEFAKPSTCSGLLLRDCGKRKAVAPVTAKQDFLNAIIEGDPTAVNVYGAADFL
jgi:hypothetical protein